MKGPSAEKPYYIIRLETLRQGTYDYYNQSKNGAWKSEGAIQRDQPWYTLIWLHWGFQLTLASKVSVNDLRAIAVNSQSWPEMRDMVSWNDKQN